MIARLRSDPAFLGLRARRVGVAILLILAGSAAIAGTFDAQYGLADSTRQVVTPIARLLPVVIGSAVGFMTEAAARDMEVMGGRRLTIITNVLVAACATFAVGSVAIAAVIGSLLNGTEPTWRVAAGFGISTLGFAGVAMLGAVILGPSYCWVPAALSVVAVTLLGYRPSGEPLWWNIAALSTSVTTAALAVGLFLVSVLAWNLLRYRRLGRVP